MSDTLIRAVLHMDPTELSDEEWADGGMGAVRHAGRKNRIMFKAIRNNVI